MRIPFVIDEIGCGAVVEVIRKKLKIGGVAGAAAKDSLTDITFNSLLALILLVLFVLCFTSSFFRFLFLFLF